MDGTGNLTGESGSWQFKNSIDLLTLQPLEEMGKGFEEMWTAIKWAFLIYLFLPITFLILMWLLSIPIGYFARRRNGKP